MSFWTDIRDAATGRASAQAVEAIKNATPPAPPKVAGVSKKTATGAKPAQGLGAYVSQSPMELALMLAAAGALIYVVMKKGGKK